MKLRFQKTLMGLAAVAAAITLAGCGKGASSTTSSSSSAAPTSAKTSKAATNKADALIQKGDYQGALDAVKNDQSNSDNQALAGDLQNYLTAKKDYQNKNYDQALTSLNTASSSSTPMKQAYTDLRTKINTARQQASQSSSSSSSNGQAVSSSKTAINANATRNTSESVINAFASKEGFNQSGYGISPVAKNGNVYRFEVRKNNADNTVANLVGIYEYNASTGAVTKIA